jgi:hypothetical protein
VKQFLLINLFLLIILSPSCEKRTDEERLKNLVKTLAEAGSRKDIKTLKEYISRDYKDAKGNDYDELRSLLAYYFLQHPRISVFITEQTVNIKGDTATVEAHAVLSSGREIKSLSDIIPQGMSFYVFIIDFKKFDSDWLIVSADWFESKERQNYRSIHELEMEKHH